MSEEEVIQQKSDMEKNLKLGCREHVFSAMDRDKLEAAMIEAAGYTIVLSNSRYEHEDLSLKARRRSSP